MAVAVIRATRQTSTRAQERGASLASLKYALLCALLVAAVVLAYQQVWHAGYIWDDDVYVTANPLLTARDGWRRIWLSLDSPSQYFPLVYSVFRLEHALWGFNPAGYHWVNICLHAANALLLWRLLYHLRIRGAWLGAALFALHPVQVESVAWITELKNVLMGFFFLLTLLYWVRFVAESRRRVSAGYYAVALFCYALALFSKTTAAILPAALLLILWLKREPITRRRWLQVTPFVVFAMVMGAVTIWWERYHQGTEGRAFAVGFVERALIASRAVWFYLSKLIWPEELSFSYPRWSISSTDPLAYVWVGLTVAAAIALWISRRYAGRSLGVAMAFFVATLAPTLGFIMLWTFRYSWVADHYQYLACIGPLTLCAAGLAHAKTKLGRSGDALFALIASAVLLLCATRTWKQAAIYADAETLWRATIQSNPHSALAHDSLGVILGEKHAPVDQEMAEYRMALEVDPNDAEALNNFGYALQRLGRVEEALEQYEKSVAADPRYTTAHGNLASLLMQMGRAQEAIAHLQEVLAIDPKNALLEDSLGDILHNQGRAEEAIEHWKRALKLGAPDSQLSAKLGRGLAAAGRVEVALPYLRSASESLPGDARAHFEYATALSLMRRFAEAIPEYQEALRIEPNLPEAHSNLAIAYVNTGQLNEAVAEYERMLASTPNNAAAHNSLSLLLRYVGRGTEADLHARRAAELGSQRSAPPP